MRTTEIASEGSRTRSDSAPRAGEVKRECSRAVRSVDTRAPWPSDSASPEELVAQQLANTRAQLAEARSRLIAARQRVSELDKAVRNWELFVAELRLSSQQAVRTYSRAGIA